MALLASHWAARGNDVTLITLDGIESDVYGVSPAVRRVALDLMRDSPTILHAIMNNYRRWRALRNAVREAQGEWVISFTDKTNVLAILACLGTNTRVAVYEQIHPLRHAIGPIWALLRRRTYGRSAAVVVQTPTVRQVVQPWARRTPVHVIPGCVWPETVPSAVPSLSSRAPQIVAMGRLSAQKGFDLLLEAFSSIAPAHPDWNLTIVGEGPERKPLEDLVQQRDLTNRVDLCGWRDDPSRLLSDSQVFVLSSRYEGFPNALLEAMACGVVPVAFDCESGPREIIRHNIDGLLVPAEDVDRLAQALASVLSDAGRRQQLATAAQEVNERFSVEAFFRRWNELLDSES